MGENCRKKKSTDERGEDGKQGRKKN